MLAKPGREKLNLLIVAVMAVVVVGAGLAAFVYSQWLSERCGEFLREYGGCDRRAVTFEATECRGIAIEWGSKVDLLLLEVIDGGRDVSTRMFGYRSTISFAAGTQMGVHKAHLECTVDEFSEMASGEFSPRFVEMVGEAMWDYRALQDWTEEDIGTYQDWIDESREIVEYLVFGRAELVASGLENP